ncbi:MAG: MBL fold metallo-hydrolase [Rhodospirillaceae bacterium]|nr:MBL fold metallo-hydrolase [Rhodospirillaceae bacterium]
MRITILGCGGSGGVPLIGEVWGGCDPANPKNRRRRVSVLVEHPRAAILIDTSPDLRAQFLDAGIKRLDAVLFTHDHADHTHGIDDLRFLRREPGARGEPIDAYADARTMATLQRRFDYIFRQKEEGSGVLYRPFLAARVFAGPFAVNGVEVVPFDQHHGLGTVTQGFRIGGFAYSTDVVELPEASMAVLEGLDLWVVDCLRFEPHPTHAHFDRVMEWVERLRPRRTVLTHLNHQMDYEALRARCPAGVEPAYDGLVVEVPN